jgi:pimeloyl-ACP methyl ester carboxylesterase
MAGLAQTPDYPPQQIRFIVPFTPGGGTDVIMRLVAHHLAEAWKSTALVIAGTADLLVPPSNSEFIAERIPGAKLVLLPGAPHRLFAENAETFNSAVLSFLAECSLS